MTLVIDTTTRDPPSPLWKIRYGFNDERNHKSKTKVRQQQHGCSALCSSSSAHSARQFRPCLPLPFRLKRDFLLFRLKVWRATCCEKENERNGDRGRFGSRRERKGADRRVDRTGPTTGPRSVEQRRRLAALRMRRLKVDGNRFPRNDADFPTDS